MKDKVVAETGEILPRLNELGQEVGSSVPMAPAVGFVKSRPLHERIREMVQHEFERARSREGVESPDEADDFVVPDDDDPREGRFALMPGYEWEENYEPPADFAEMRKRLIDAGWTPPAKKDAPAAPAPSVAPSKAVADPLHGGSDGSQETVGDKK